MREDTVSPDGRLRIEWNYSSGRMSHDIWSPTLYDTLAGQVILTLGAGTWDASFDWPPDGIAHMHLRNYSEGGGTILTVHIDPAHQLFRSGDDAWQPFTEMQTAVPAAFFRHRGNSFRARPSGGSPKSGPAPAIVRETRLDLVALLAIIIGLLGGCAYLTLEVWRLPEAVAFTLTFAVLLSAGYGLFRRINRS